METYKGFRAWLLPVLFTGLISTVVYVYKAQAAQMTQALERVQVKQAEQGERLAKLEALVEQQKVFNERLLDLLERR